MATLFPKRAGLGVEPTSNIGMQIAQELPYPGKRTLRGGMARKEADSEGQMLRARELGLVAQLKGAFHELRFIYEALDILRRNQSVLQRLAKVAEARYSVGRAMQQDLIKSQVEISILDSRLIPLEQRKASITAEIVALLNRQPGSDLGRPEAALASARSATAGSAASASWSGVAPCFGRSRPSSTASSWACRWPAKSTTPTST